MCVVCVVAGAGHGLIQYGSLTILDAAKALSASAGLAHDLISVVNKAVLVGAFEGRT